MRECWPQSESLGQGGGFAAVSLGGGVVRLPRGDLAEQKERAGLVHVESVRSRELQGSVSGRDRLVQPAGGEEGQDR